MRRILLVEDNERIVEFLRRGLSAEGYEVRVARDGEQALTLGEDPGFTVILLDLMLPRLDGREVCRRLRQANIATPILMLTALDALQDKVDGLRMGADDYLAKPFAFDELLARIEALIRRQGGYRAQPGRLRIGDLVLDHDTREARQGERLLALTPKEFALLACFMRQPGIVLSRTRLLEQVWGADTDPLTNVVEVYIRHLRNKLDNPATGPLIETVRGFGYKLNAVET